MDKCNVLCEKCEKNTPYQENEKNRCVFCGNELLIDREIESLVVALNKVGIITFASCAGVQDGFDRGLRSYPWVAVLNDDRNTESVKRILEGYNERIGRRADKEWEVEFQKTTMGISWFIVPKGKERSIEKLWREADLLSKYIRESYKGA